MNHIVDIVVSNDLVTDNRVHKVSQSLLDMGFTPRVTGRLRKNSMPLGQRPYATHRIPLLFDRGHWFYFELNVRFFFRLFFSRAHIILSNDLDTLGAAFLAAKLGRKQLVYDSHEYFTEVPELIGRQFKQNVWKRLEKIALPRLKHATTVSQSIANEYQQQYGVQFKVVRNLPHRRPLAKKTNHHPGPKKLNDDKIILYQGSLNLGRGLEFIIQAMRHIHGASLWIVGSGDLEEFLRILTRSLNLQYKVRFFGQIPFEELSPITAQADLGISIEEDLGLNYRFALPNKLFDYIQHQVPVLVSQLPEMQRIVQQYGIGEVLKSREPDIMAAQITDLLQNNEKRAAFRKKLPIAANELCWENEVEVLHSIFNQLK